MIDELLTVKDVANYLNMHKITVYKMVNRGIIPAFKIGGQWRFKKELLDKWLVEGMSRNNKRPDNSETDIGDLQGKEEIKKNE